MATLIKPQLLLAALLILIAGAQAIRPAALHQAHDDQASSGSTTAATDNDAQAPAGQLASSTLTTVASKGGEPANEAPSTPVSASKSAVRQSAQPTDSEASLDGPKEEKDDSELESDQAEDNEPVQDEMFDVKKKLKEKFKKKGFELEMLAEKKMEFFKSMMSDDFKMAKLRGLEDLIKFFMSIFFSDAIKTFLPHKSARRGHSKRPIWEKTRDHGSRYQQAQESSTDEGQASLASENRPSKATRAHGAPTRRRRRPRRRPKISVSEEADMESLDGGQAELLLLRDPKSIVFEKLASKEFETGPSQRARVQRLPEPLIEARALESALELLHQLKMAKLGAGKRRIESDDSEQAGEPTEPASAAAESESESEAGDGDGNVSKEESKRSEIKTASGDSFESGKEGPSSSAATTPTPKPVVHKEADSASTTSGQRSTNKEN